MNDDTIWDAPEVASLGDFAALRSSAMQSVFKAFERASEGTLIVDRDARIVWISEKHARRFGLREPRQAFGRHVEEIIPNSRMREVVTSGQPIPLDILDVPDKPLVVTRMPLKNEEGGVVGAVAFALFDEWASLAPLVSRFLAMQEELAEPTEHAQAMSQYERQLIERALAESPTVVAAARRLGIGRATLYRKMASLQLGSRQASGT